MQQPDPSEGTHLFRPTLYQIHVLHWPPGGQEAVYACVANAVQHVAVAAPAAAEALRDQLAPVRWPQLHSRDARYSLVKTDAWHPVPDHDPLRLAFFADQDGTAVILHFIWYWDGPGDLATFQALRRRVWTPASKRPASNGEPLEDWGAGFLLSAVLTDETERADEVDLAHKIVAPFLHSDLSLTPLALNGAKLYADLRPPLRSQPWPAVLLFDSAAVEATREADRFATVAWPTVVLYYRRLEQLYLQEYRTGIASRLAEHKEALQRALETTFGPQVTGVGGHPQPRLLARNDLGQMQQALADLSGSQYSLLDALSDAEACTHAGRRDLVNLVDAVRGALAIPFTGSAPAAEAVEASVSKLTRRHDQFVAQMASDVTSARNVAERAARAVDVLRTQADILEAGYERGLNIIVAVLGVALAAGQLAGDDLADWLWEHGGRAIWSQISVEMPDAALQHLLIRLLVMLVTGLVTWFAIRLYGRLAQ